MPRIINLPKEEIRPVLEKLKANYPEIFKIHSHTNQWEKALIYSLCEKLPTGSVMFEIGAHLGATSCIMGTAAKEINGEVFCVDTWDNQNFPGEPPTNTFYTWKENTGNCHVGNWTFPIKGDSIFCAKHCQAQWTNFIIKLIFFDADHSYEGITGDIKAWLPLCTPGCCLIFHDYGGKDGRPAIRRAVEELIFPIQKGPGYMFESIYYCWKG